MGQSGRPGAGRVRLRPNRGFPRRTRLRRQPSNHSFESTTICAAIGIVRQKMRDSKIQPLVRARRERIKSSGREFVGVMLLSEAKLKPRFGRSLTLPRASRLACRLVRVKMPRDGASLSATPGVRLRAMAPALTRSKKRIPSGITTHDIAVCSKAVLKRRATCSTTGAPWAALCT